MNSNKSNNQTCIYLGHDKSLTFTGREHIFPASLGGINKLDCDCVSNQANNLLSKLEGELIHNSVIQLCRSFNGPGIRGRKDKPTGRVEVLVDPTTNKPALGFVFSGKPQHIAHIFIDGNHFDFVANSKDFEDTKINFDVFMSELRAFDLISTDFRYTEIPCKNLKDDQILIGYTCNKKKRTHKWYLAHSAKISNEQIMERVKAIFESAKRIEVGTTKYQPHLEQHIKESEEADRAYAKTALNVICKLYGKEIACNKNFDDFRKWVISGEPHRDNWLNEDVVPNFGIGVKISKHAHWCLIFVEDNSVFAVVCFYNCFARRFYIGEKPNELPNERNGYICDWENNKEYTLNEYILHLSLENHEKLIGISTDSN